MITLSLSIHLKHFVETYVDLITFPLILPFRQFRFLLGLVHSVEPALVELLLYIDFQGSLQIIK